MELASSGRCSLEVAQRGLPLKSGTCNDVPKCQHCGFWLEHGDQVTQGKGQTGAGIVLTLTLIGASAAGYFWGEDAAGVVAILGAIALVPFAFGFALARGSQR